MLSGFGCVCAACAYSYQVIEQAPNGSKQIEEAPAIPSARRPIPTADRSFRAAHGRLPGQPENMRRVDRAIQISLGLVRV
jgi:hypothetical protein